MSRREESRTSHIQSEIIPDRQRSLKSQKQIARLQELVALPRRAGGNVQTAGLFYFLSGGGGRVVRSVRPVVWLMSRKIRRIPKIYFGQVQIAGLHATAHSLFSRA